MLNKLEKDTILHIIAEKIADTERYLAKLNKDHSLYASFTDRPLMLNTIDINK